MWFSLIFCIFWMLFIFISIAATKWVVAAMSILTGDKEGLRYNGDLCRKDFPTYSKYQNIRYPTWDQDWNNWRDSQHPKRS